MQLLNFFQHILDFADEVLSLTKKGDILRKNQSQGIARKSMWLQLSEVVKIAKVHSFTTSFDEIVKKK